MMRTRRLIARLIARLWDGRARPLAARLAQLCATPAARRRASMAAVLLTVGSCASPGPPRDVADACAILSERPEWRDALVASAKRWGAPVDVQMAIMWRESAFVGDAKPPRDYILWVIPWGRKSSAYGYSQAIDGTWDWYRNETGNSWASRDDFDDAADFVGWYMARSNRVNGIAMADAYNQYLAYHEGHAGYTRGNHRDKSWLRGAAAEVRSMASRYASQLSVCPAVAGRLPATAGV